MAAGAAADDQATMKIARSSQTKVAPAVEGLSLLLGIPELSSHKRLRGRTYRSCCKLQQVASAALFGYHTKLKDWKTSRLLRVVPIFFFLNRKKG